MNQAEYFYELNKSDDWAGRAESAAPLCVDPLSESASGRPPGRSGQAGAAAPRGSWESVETFQADGRTYERTELEYRPGEEGGAPGNAAPRAVKSAAPRFFTILLEDVNTLHLIQIRCSDWVDRRPLTFEMVRMCAAVFCEENRIRIVSYHKPGNLPGVHTVDRDSRVWQVDMSKAKGIEKWLM